MRLSNGMRDSIVAAILRDREFPAKITAAEAALRSEVLTEYEKLYPKDEASMVVVREWADTNSYISLENERGYGIESFHGYGRIFEHQGKSPRVKITPKITALVEARDAANKAKIEAEEIIRAVLNSCSTTKQLIDTAPELARYVPDESGPVTALVDMATVQRLRYILG